MVLLNPIINLKNVHLTLNSGAGPVHILRGVDLEVTEGEAIGIVGPSGSGKSTLLAVMTGLEQASEGRVLIDGMDYGALNEDKLALHRRDRIGIILQSFHLIPTMTALENVSIPMELSGDNKAFKKAEEELKLLGLGHRLIHYPSQLSGGEQQRVAVARALINNPAIILADEPSGNLDTESAENLHNLFFKLRDEFGQTFVIVTHNKDLAAMADRKLIMQDGTIISD
jgi:putative ABC transport system ATP-binding protein